MDVAAAAAAEGAATLAGDAAAAAAGAAAAAAGAGAAALSFLSMQTINISGLYEISANVSVSFGVFPWNSSLCLSTCRSALLANSRSFTARMVSDGSAGTLKSVPLRSFTWTNCVVRVPKGYGSLM